MIVDLGRPDAQSVTAESQGPRFAGAAVVRWAVKLAWIANILLLGVLVSAFFRGQQLDQALAQHELWLLARPVTGLATNLSTAEADARIAYLGALGAAAVVSAVIMVVGLFVGAPRHRSIRSWLALTALAAAWLLVLITWPEIVWAGQRWRLGRSLDELEAIAAPLRDHWPTDDGADERLGAYSAYPIGHPQMLQVIAAPRDSTTATRIVAVERSPRGALRFELGGDEAGAWVEWHPQGSSPASFVGATMFNGEYKLNRTAPLGDGWYLSRYEISGVPYTF